MKKNKEKAVIALYDQQGRVLLQDRHGISGAGEQWGFFGGSVEAGETPEQALAREIREELGIELESHDFLVNYKVFLLDNQSYNYIHLFIGFLGNILEHAKQQEGRAMKLFTTSEAKNLIMNKTDINKWEYIEEYFKKRNII
ncbi:MAG: NUDIX hydrolase [Patescibacteria group bacterium]|jgi:8-oxo-dGTP diphosphatase